MSATRTAVVAAVCFAAAPFAIAACVAILAEASGALSPPATAAACVVADSGGAPASSQGLDSTQTGNARIINDVAISMGLPAQAAIIGIATAMQESTLRNLPYGDRDSLGLFQQRPSQGWGTPAQIMNPVYAATAFYKALIQVPGWQQLPITVAAQAVQHSGYPGAYARWQQLATALVSSFGGTHVSCLGNDGRGEVLAGSTALPAGYTIPPGTPAPVVAAIDYAAAQLGKPYVWGGTGPGGFDCSGLVMMAYRAGGISLPRTTFEQVHVGTPVYGIGQLQPGDLLFTAGADGTAQNPGHIGMFLGDGLVIDAPQTGQNVQITPLNGYWSSSTVAIRRIAT